VNIQKLKKVVPGPLHPYLGAARRWVRALGPRTRFQKRRLLSDVSLSEGDRELLEKVSSRIYFNDGMYQGNGVHYFKVGLSAIHCIDEAIERARLTNVGAILDLPCGSGRVMRFLRHRFPEAEITACELAPGPVQFCVRTFGAVPALSSLNLDEVSLDKKFDLIWCGSLVTHLNHNGIVSLFKLFRRHLAKGGLMVFTSHGEFVARRLPTRGFDYGIAADQIEKLPLDYLKTGFAFADYPGEKDYGVSLTSPEWLRARISEAGDLREVFFKERGWDDHQDVFGFVRE
jgi:SAM-dependent methyltransferase